MTFAQWFKWILGTDHLNSIERLKADVSKARSTVDTLAEALTGALNRIESLEKELERQRFQATAEPKPKPTPIVAKNWREVQKFTARDEELDAAG